ncbi:MAG: CoA transferase subunit A [Clostridiales Family XIII bacterium]|nr:CoA transferase subunit A [Clostridiales Family XIII bacterium]
MVENKFKKIKTVKEAMEFIKDGITLMVSGFGGIGSSYALIKGVVDKGVKDLTVISVDAGDPNVGADPIIIAKQAKKLITSHIGATKAAGEQLNAGELEVEFSPQGTLAERIRAGGVGIPGFLTDVGMGTVIEEGKKKVDLDGKEYLLETALKADVAILLAEKADEFGNLVYSKTAEGLNPLMARAAKTTIVAAKEIVPIGSLDPQRIKTQGAYVDVIVQEEGEFTFSWQE